MSKKLLRNIKIVTVAFFITILIFSLIISQDEHHIEICHEEHCAICAIIHIAQNIINLSTIIVTCVFIGFLIFFFLSRIHKENFIFVHSSLVFQKVQLNE